MIFSIFKYICKPLQNSFPMDHSSFFAYIQGILKSKDKDYYFTFIKGKESLKISTKVLIIKALNFANHLKKISAPNDRVCISLPTSVEFYIAFLGSILADRIAVPTFIPYNDHMQSSLKGILQDCEASVLIGIEKYMPDYYTNTFLSNLDVEHYSLASDNTKLSQTPKDNPILFLQYTSGSTGKPKGVSIRENNLLGTVSGLMRNAPPSNSKVHVWTPLFHNMGIIAGIFLPLFSKYHTYVASPDFFTSNPVRWIKFISEEKINATILPNFALDQCSHAFNAGPANIDLSQLSHIYVGGESIKESSINYFLKTFKEYGIKAKAILPSYGLSEVTLIASMVSPQSHQIISKKLDSLPTTLISCGQSIPENEIIIYSPDSNSIAKENTIGHILICGSTVSENYWGKNNEMPRSEINGKFYWDTGDLGFMDEVGNIYISGRSKDLIIIKGKNYYPNDIEEVIYKQLPQAIPGGSVALGIEIDQKESLVLVIEISNFKAEERRKIITIIAKNIFKKFQIAVSSIYFVEKFTLPRTATGKLPHHKIKEMLLTGQLKAFVEYHKQNKIIEQNISTVATEHNGTLNWLSKWLVYNLSISENFNVDESIDQLNIDSIIIFRLCFDIESEFKKQITPEQIVESATIRNIAKIIDDLPTITLLKKEKVENIPLLTLERHYLDITQNNPENESVAILSYVNINKPLDLQKAKSDINMLTKKYDAFQMGFLYENNEFKRFNAVPHYPEILFEDLRGMNFNALQKRKETIIKELFENKIEVNTPPLCRFKIIQTSDKSFGIYFLASHLIFDGWSKQIVLNDFLRNYIGSKYVSKEVIHSYNDFLSDFNDYIHSEKYSLDKIYWENFLSNVNVISNSWLEEKQKDYSAFTIAQYLPIESVNKFSLLARKEKVREEIVFSAIFELFIASITKHLNFQYKKVLLNRSNIQYLNTPGLFTNSIIESISIEKETSLIDQISKVQERHNSHEDHLLFPFQDIINLLASEYVEHEPKIVLNYTIISPSPFDKIVTSDPIFPPYIPKDNTRIAFNIYRTVNGIKLFTRWSFPIDFKPKAQEISNSFNSFFNKILIDPVKKFRPRQI